MRDPYPQAAPNYMNACIVLFGVNITWIFTVIWAIWGLIFVIALGVVINRAITILEAHARARAARARANPRAKFRSSI